MFSLQLIIAHVNGDNKIMEIDVIESELHIYNSKMRLLSWLYDEIQIQSDRDKELINKIGQDLPLNL